MADFHFDFEAVKGLEYTEAFQALFQQMEDHYNSNFSSPKLIFGGPPKAKAADKVAPPAEKPPKGVDVETVTPTTVGMKTFVIRESAAGDRKMIVGTDSAGKPVNDLLLPGYDEEPYGPVVSGEQGRYNLKGK